MYELVSLFRMDGCCFRCFLLNVRERAVVALVFRNGWKVLSVFIVFWLDVAGVFECFMPKGRAFSSELCRFSDSLDDVVETFEFCPEYDFTIRVAFSNEDVISISFKVKASTSLSSTP